MGDTFGGTWNRPTHNGRGKSFEELEDRASYDNQPQTSYAGCFVIAMTALAAIAAALGVVLG